MLATHTAFSLLFFPARKCTIFLCFIFPAATICQQTNIIHNSNSTFDHRPISSMTPSTMRPVIDSPWTESPRRGTSQSPSPSPIKMKSMADIMARAKRVEEKLDPPESDDDDDELYSQVSCKQCNSGERAEEMLLCDKCDSGYHMKCLRPIVVRVPIGSWFCPNCSAGRDNYKCRVQIFSQKRIKEFFHIETFSHERRESELQKDMRKRRRRARPLVFPKRRRRLLPFVPSEDPDQRLKQLHSLASALTAMHMEFSDELTYRPGMARRSANEALFENGGVQILTREDSDTLDLCKAMCKRGECPPLMVVFDTCEGYTVEADGPIKDMTIIAEYTGDVDFINNREYDDCDSMMTLILNKDSAGSLVICPDRRGNITRFINGINNHTMEGRKKQNCKCIRYNVDDECRVLLVATRDIHKCERLYYNYNGYENQYPTEHFL